MTELKANPPKYLSKVFWSAMPGFAENDGIFGEAGKA